ncbi:M20/M25/M40 family metallo-hydrolase [Candidatus Microgenomates bacterium]|nr:M20/M25/M40 family metallo-hydrolase [Candidatus Microgenomates bacterium]
MSKKLIRSEPERPPTKLLSHLRRMVAYYPVSSDQLAVKKVLTYFKQQLPPQFRDTQIIRNESVYSLVSSTQSTIKPKVLLQAHVDVVPAPTRQRRMQQVGRRLYGRGVYDMLFAPAIYLQLVNELVDLLHQLDIGIMFSGDEELGGFASVPRLLKEGWKPDICILPDAGDSFGSLSASAKGFLTVRMQVKGKAHHGSRPWDGDGAADKLIRFLNELLNQFDRSSKLNSTACVTQLEAGQAINQAPAQAQAWVDIRYRDQADYKRIIRLLDRLCRRYQGRISAHKLGHDFKLDAKQPLVQSFLKMYREAAKNGVRLVHSHGSSDARFFAAKKIPVIMLRPAGGGTHADDEWVSVAEIEKVRRLLKQFLLTQAKI